MYFKKATPESVGISSDKVRELMEIYDKNGLCTHSILIAKGDKIFLESYYQPFTKDFKHRMYSVTKSFVGIAILFLADEGKISLDDKFASFFEDDLTEHANDLLRETTIKDMLTMETSVHSGTSWFKAKHHSRVDSYFAKPSDKISGTLFEYDSAGSYMLGVIVEKITGKPFIEYLREKFLDDIGFSKDAYCLKAPGGYSWGDSALMCTSEDLLRVARFVMNKGEWNGKQYIDKKLMEDATSPLVCNDNKGLLNYNTRGYGYQIWMAPDGGFSFNGMGCQFAICHPKTDLAFVITSDNQGNDFSKNLIFYELYKTIIENMGEPMEENEEAYKKLCDYASSRKLLSLKEERDNPFIKEINNVKYKLEENPMNIDWISLSFEGKKGVFRYKNLQGEKELAFGIGYNEFGVFPEEGYSDMVGNEYCPGNYYKCACSADWGEEKKLRIKVQIIDKYFGQACFVLSFKDNRVYVSMEKTAEYFMMEYVGKARGKIMEM